MPEHRVPRSWRPTPLRTEITKLLPYERYMGIQSTFERVGFEVVAQESGRRPVMRYRLGEPVSTLPGT